MSGLLDEALFKGDETKAQLDTGLANRLAAAAVQLGAYSVPTGTHTANGMKWQALWARAGFHPGEILAVLTWLEEAYSAELAKRAADPLPSLAPTEHLGAALDKTPRPPGLPAPSRAAKDDAPPSRLDFEAGSYKPYDPSAAVETKMVTATEDAAFVHPNLAADIEAMHMNQGDIADSNFMFLTGSSPPPNSTDIKYASDPTKTKLWTRYSGAGQTTLVSLFNSKTSTIMDFNSHFLTVTQQMRQAGQVIGVELVTSAWMEIQNAMPTVELMRIYMREYTRVYAGRFLPIKVDQKLVLKSMTLQMSGGSDVTLSVNQLTSELSAMRSELAAVTAAVEALRTSSGAVKQDVNNLKDKMASMGPLCTYCHRPGHKAKDCQKKKKDEETAAAAPPAAN
jgi:hypothetical protein